MGIKGDAKKLRGPAEGKSVAVQDTEGSSLDWCVSEVNRVQLLLLTETWRPWSGEHQLHDRTCAERRREYCGQRQWL